MFDHIRLGPLFAPLALVLGQAAVSGCASSEAQRGPSTPSDQAKAFQQARCTGVADDGTVANVIDGKAVEGVRPLYSGVSSRTGNARLLGATLYVRPALGETAEWLNRALECHSAKRTSERTAAFAGSDPFFLPDSVVSIRVQAAADRFKVDIQSTSSADAREILARATTFASASRAAQGIAAQPELP
jgi:hypothetical protein